MKHSDALSFGVPIFLAASISYKISGRGVFGDATAIKTRQEYTGARGMTWVLQWNAIYKGQDGESHASY